MYLFDRQGNLYYDTEDPRLGMYIVSAFRVFLVGLGLGLGLGSAAGAACTLPLTGSALLLCPSCSWIRAPPGGRPGRDVQKKFFEVHASHTLSPFSHAPALPRQVDAQGEMCRNQCMLLTRSILPPCSWIRAPPGGRPGRDVERLCEQGRRGGAPGSGEYPGAQQHAGAAGRRSLFSCPVLPCVFAVRLSA